MDCMKAALSSRKSQKCESLPIEALPLSFKVIKCSTIESKYTVYCMEVSTNFKTWTIQYRYRHFRHLFKNIALSNQAEMIGNTNFPKKKLFKLRKQVVRERSQALEAFMNQLCQEPEHLRQMLDNKDFCKFIQIEFLDKDLVLNQAHEQEVINQTSLQHSRSENCRSVRLLSLSSAYPLSSTFKNKDQIIKDFIQLLNEEDDQKSQIPKGLEKYLVLDQNQISVELITRLLIGDSYKQRGLLHFIGCVETEPQFSFCCLQLLYKLLDYQRNNYADIFAKVFSRQEVSLIKSMKLDHHIKKSCNSKDYALFILYTYMQYNSRIPDIRLFLTDKGAIEIYHKYRRVRKNYKDMNLCEPKNVKASVASFRKSISTTATTSEEESNPNSSIKKVKAKNRLTPVPEDTRTFTDVISTEVDPNFCFSNSFDLKLLISRIHQNQFLHDHQWKFEYSIDGEVPVYSKYDSLLLTFHSKLSLFMINFETKIQYDNLCLDICQQDTTLVQKLLQSISLLVNYSEPNKLTLCLSQKMQMTCHCQIIPQGSSYFILLQHADEQLYQEVETQLPAIQQKLDVVKEEEEEEEKVRTLSSKPSQEARAYSNQGSSSSPSSDTPPDVRYVNVRALVGFSNDILRNEIFNSILRLRNRSFYHSLI